MHQATSIPWPSFKGYVFNVMWFRLDHLWKTQVCWLLHSTSCTKTGRGNVHQVTQSLLAGKISTQQTDNVQGIEDERHYRNQRLEIQCIKPSASHLSAFPYHILKSFLLCKILTASTLLNLLPKALMHFRESVFIFWDVAITGTNTTGACS